VRLPQLSVQQLCQKKEAAAVGIEGIEGMEQVLKLLLQHSDCQSLFDRQLSQEMERLEAGLQVCCCIIIMV
jgi:hypothetical protein